MVRTIRNNIGFAVPFVLLLLLCQGCASEETARSSPFSGAGVDGPGQSYNGSDPNGVVGTPNMPDAGIAIDDKDIGEPGVDGAEPDTTVGEVDTFEPPPNCIESSECDDENTCTQDECVAGECSYSTLQGACDDGDPCTEGDQCDGVTCAGSQMPCDDGNACTTDSCVNGCVHVPVDTPECTLAIVLTAPDRGEVVYNNPVVAVSGYVDSPVSNVSTFTLNGDALELSEDGTFSTAYNASVGVNLLLFEAENTAGQTARKASSFAYGDGIHEPGSLLQVNPVVGGSGAWIDEQVFDDDDMELDDIAALVTLLLETFDINPLIPHPVLGEGDGPNALWCNWDVDIDTTPPNEISYTIQNVEIVPETGGIVVSGSLANFEAWVDAVADGFLCPDAKGWIRASEALVMAELNASISPSGQIVMNVVSVNSVISNVEVDLEEGAASYFNWLIDWFEDDLADLIEDKLETYVPDEILPLVQTVLDEISHLEENFVLPALPGGSAQELSMVIAAKDAVFSPDGLEIVLRTGVATNSGNGIASPGSIARGTCGGGGAGVNPVVGEASSGSSSTGGSTGSGLPVCCEEQADGVKGCIDPFCEDCVCEVDPYCCTTQWDGICATKAEGSCDEVCGCSAATDFGENTGPFQEGACCEGQSGKGCQNASCESCVCNVDDYCCDVVWDSNCGGTAKVNCASQCNCDPSTSGVQPTAVGSCVDECGEKSGDCWCDALCPQNGDCCADACAACGYCANGGSEPVGDVGEYVFPKQAPIEARVHEDQINQVLHALWSGGYTNLQIDPIVLEPFLTPLNATGMDLQVVPMLPPMVTTCTEDGELEVHLGGILCDAKFTFNGVPAAFKLYAAIKTEIALVIVEVPGQKNELGVQLKELEAFQVDIIETEGLGTLGDALIQSVLNDGLVQLLVADLLNNLIATYPVPSLDLSTLISTLPAGTIATGEFFSLEWEKGNLEASGVIFNE